MKPFIFRANGDSPIFRSHLVKACERDGPQLLAAWFELYKTQNPKCSMPEFMAYLTEHDFRVGWLRKMEEGVEHKWLVIEKLEN